MTNFNNYTKMNAQTLVNQIRHDQQRQHLDFYQSLITSYSSIESTATNVIHQADLVLTDHTELTACISSVDRDAHQIMTEHERFHQSLSEMRLKQQILHALHQELTLTDQEKSVLIASDEEEVASAKIKRERQLLSMDQVASEVDENEDANNKFERFKAEFFQALNKLNRMQEIAQVFKSDLGTSTLAQSVMDSVRYVEEAAYGKLVKHLKNKIKVFDTPLENQPEFLIFMKVTLKMLREKSIDIYGHIINELIKARASYIELSFQEKMNFIYQSDKAKKNTERVSNAKNVVQTITWLHETLVNEIQILDHTSLDKTRYLDALNNIFGRNLAKKLKQKLDQEIQSQEDFSHSFELYFMVVSFYQIMHENFVVKLKLSQKDDLSDLIILSFITELKQKSLIQMADCAEPFLSKLHNLFLSQASESTLQIERFIKVTERIFTKVIDIMKTDKKDLDVFKKRILSYAIIRILPSMKIQNFAKDTNMLSANLVHLYNYYDSLFHLLKSFNLEFFADSIQEIKKRMDYLSTSLKQAAVYIFQQKLCYKQVLSSTNLTDFSLALDDLLEDLDLEDASGFSKSQKQSPLLALQSLLVDQQLKQFLVELIKEEILSCIREALAYVVDLEQNQILSNGEMEEDERERKMRIVSHVEFEMTERIELIKKKIAQK